jgi:hypothetical protein
MKTRRDTILIFAALLAAGSLLPAAAQSTLAPALVWHGAINGEELSSLRWPMAVASAEAGEVAVADAGTPRLIVFRLAGGEWAAAATVPLPAPPVGLVAVGGRYLLSLRGETGLLEFEREKWTYRTVALPPATVPGALAATPDGGLLVYDDARRLVFQRSKAGPFSSGLPVPGPVKALAAGRSGDFFAAVAHQGVVVHYGSTGEELDRWPVPGVAPSPSWPVGLAVTSGGELLVLDRTGGRVVLLDARGAADGAGSRKGWDAGLLRYPAGLALGPDGLIVVADQGNGRVQLFRAVAAGE